MFFKYQPLFLLLLSGYSIIALAQESQFSAKTGYEQSQIKQSAITIPLDDNNNKLHNCSLKDEVLFKIKDIEFTSLERTGQQRTISLDENNIENLKNFFLGEIKAKNLNNKLSSEYYSLCQIKEGLLPLISEYKRMTKLALIEANVPAQELVNGVLTIQFIHGWLENYELSDNNIANPIQPEKMLLLKDLLGQNIGGSPTVQDLERATLLFGEITGTNTSVTLKQGMQPLGTILVLNAEPVQSVSGGVSVNNLGSPFTGKNQALGSLNFYNSLLDGDHLSLSYTTTEDGNSLRNYSGSYDFPANSSGMRLGMTSALTHYALTGNFSQTGGVGQAKIIGLNSKIPIEINSDFRDDFSWGVNHVELLDTTLTTFSPRKLNEIWTDLRGVAVYSLGNSSFGFGITSGNLDTENSNILATSGSYQLFNFDTKQQLTQKNLDELLSLRLQLANKNLDSYHKFALGGATAVRAFPIGEASGDIGLVATSEIGYTTSNMAGVFRLAGFYDVGKVDYNFAPLTSITNTLVLSGYGIQIDWTSSKRSKLSFFIAKPYGGDRQISVVDGSSTRTGASLNCSF